MYICKKQNMKFINYCVIIMGDTKDVFNEIEKISDSKPNVLDAKGIVITTFSSALNVKELTDWFKLNNRSFFIFDLDPENSGYSIIKKDIHNGLFGFLDIINKEVLEERASKLMDAIEEAKIISEDGLIVENDTNEFIKVERKIIPRRFTELEILEMTSLQKDELLNRIIDNGVENITEHDKKIIPFLVK